MAPNNGRLRGYLGPHGDYLLRGASRRTEFLEGEVIIDAVGKSMYFGQRTEEHDSIAKLDDGNFAVLCWRDYVDSNSFSDNKLHFHEVRFYTREELIGILAERVDQGPSDYLDLIVKLNSPEYTDE